MTLEQLRKYIQNKFKIMLNESMDNAWTEENPWASGFKNTKLFEISGFYGREFLQGCRHCNTVVKLKNMYEERQYVGNIYQSLCNCENCGRFVVFDENKKKEYELYFKYPDNYKIISS